jgi:hypothetical protein
MNFKDGSLALGIDALYVDCAVHDLYLRRGGPMITDLVNISDLNQYLYCPRRLYYLMFFKTQEINVHLADGRGMHARQGRRGGWYREVYLRSERLGLHGKVDLIDIRNGAVPVERKRGYAYYENDLVQLAAYAMLLEEHLDEPGASWIPVSLWDKCTSSNRYHGAAPAEGYRYGCGYQGNAG